MLHPETGRVESDEERVDRNLQEMLGELRVALPGVQVLFAFLLVVPFNQRFDEVTSFERTVYFVTLMCTAASAICLIAPSAHHRLEFRRQNKAEIVKAGNKIVVVGLGLLGIAMTGAVLFVTDVLYDSATTAIAAGGVAAAFAVLWFGIPLRRRLRRIH
jgi:O-antigen/teichoic acid export membrane protein